jgi:hypothetical protein
MTQDLCRAEFDRIWLMATDHFKNHPYIRDKDLKDLCFTFWEKGWNASQSITDDTLVEIKKNYLFFSGNKMETIEFSTRQNPKYWNFEPIDIYKTPEPNPADNSQNIEWTPPKK